MEALHGLGGNRPLVPDCQANLFAWGWLMAVVASALQNHPQWPLGMRGADEQAWQDSARQLRYHDHLLTDRYWAAMWAWRQVHPDQTMWKEMRLGYFWPDASAGAPDDEARQEIPDCYVLRTFSTGHCDSEEDASPARSVPGKGVNINRQKSWVSAGGAPFQLGKTSVMASPTGVESFFCVILVTKGTIMNVFDESAQRRNAKVCSMRMLSGGAGLASCGATTQCLVCSTVW